MHTLWTQDEYIRSYLFAARAHRGQPWPGDKDLNYMVHIDLVSMEVIAALQAEPQHDGDLAVKCALLHDVIEDTKVNYDDIKIEFGLKVADGVSALTKRDLKDKKLKMADSLSRIQHQPYEVWMVKMADRIINLQPPPISWTKDKIQEYKQEAIEIYDALKPANQYLASRLNAKIAAYRT